MEKSKKSFILNMLVILAFTLLGFLFAALCLPYLGTGVLINYKTALTVGLFLIPALLSALAVIFYLIKKESWYKLSIVLYIMVDFFYIFFYCLLLTKFFVVIENAENFEEYLRSAGGWMGALYTVLQFLQVIILPLPSFVTLVAGTALFGPNKTFLYSYFAITIGSVVAFYIGRLLGNKAVVWMVGKETLDKWMKKIKGKDYFLLTAMFVLPFFPDDVLCFIAGLSTMTAPYFIIMVILVRAFTVATTCYSFGMIPYDTPWGIAIWCVIGVVVVLSFILFCKYQVKIQDFISRKKKRR